MNGEYYQTICEVKEKLADYDYEHVLSVSQSLLDIVYALDVHNKELEERIQRNRVQTGELCRIIDELVKRVDGVKDEQTVAAYSPYKKTRRGKRGGKRVREQEKRRQMRGDIVPGEELYSELDELD